MKKEIIGAFFLAPALLGKVLQLLLLGICLGAALGQSV
jgi:hypothetical protein